MSLVLSRKLGEVILIGDDIEIMVVGIDSRHVKLAITAPRSVAINRKEIHLRILAEKEAQT